MKTLALSKWLSLYKGIFPESEKTYLIRAFQFLLIVIFILITSGCSKDELSSENELLIERRDLLTSTIWGEESICGYDSDPEKFSRIFKPGGQFEKYFKIYQNLFGVNWSLKDSETLIFWDDEYKIRKLDENNLEIQSLFCISKFQALSQTKIITLGVTALSQTSARLHGSVRTCTLTDILFEYGTSSNYGNTVTPVNNSITGPTIKIVSTTLSGLNPETVYHYRIKAEDSFGIYYGEDLTFKTFNSETVTDADNNIYNNVTIGSQIWMTENLKTTKYNDGTAIPLVRDSDDWMGLSTPAYCWYNNDSLNYKSVYGALYNWYAVNTEKLCPDGWHIPNDMDWNTLKQYIGQDAGSKLTEGAYDLDSPILYTNSISQTEASNETGFSARFSGIRTSESYFYTGSCELWSRTEDDLQNARIVSISSGYDVLPISENKKNGLGVRCVKD